MEEVLYDSLAFLIADDLDCLELVNRELGRVVSANIRRLPGRSLKLAYSDDVDLDYKQPRSRFLYVGKRVRPELANPRDEEENEDHPWRIGYTWVNANMDVEPERLKPLFSDPKLASVSEFNVWAVPSPRDRSLLDLLVPETLPPLPTAETALGDVELEDYHGILTLLVEGWFSSNTPTALNDRISWAHFQCSMPCSW